MGWRGMVRSIEAAANRAEREADHQRHRAQRESDYQRRRAEAEADRERQQLDSLRMKALSETAKGQRGVWTAEYEGRLAAIADREAAAIAQAEAHRLDNVRRADERRAREGMTLKILGACAFIAVAFGACSACLSAFAPPEPPEKPAATRTPVPAPKKR